MACPNDLASIGYVDGRYNQLKAQLDALEKKLGTKTNKGEVRAMIGSIVPILFLGLIAPTNTKISGLQIALKSVQSFIASLFANTAKALGMSSAALAQSLAALAQLASVLTQIYHYIALNNQDGQLWAAIDRLEQSINSSFNKVINAVQSTNQKLARVEASASRANAKAEASLDAAKAANRDIKTTNQKVALLNSKIATINNKIIQLEGKITQALRKADISLNFAKNLKTHIDQEISKIQSKFPTLETRMQKEINTKINQIKKEIDIKINQIKREAQLKIDALKLQLRNELKGVINEAKGLIKQLESEFTAFKKKTMDAIRALEISIDILRAKILELASFVDQARETLARYGIDIRKLVSENSQQWGDISRIQTTLTGVSNSLNSVRNLILNGLGTLSNSMSNKINNFRTNLENRINNIDMNTPQLTNGLNNLNRKIDLNNGQLNGIALSLVGLTALTHRIGNNINQIQPTTCRFHEDTISPQIKVDTEIIKAQNIATQGGVATNIGLTTAIQNTTNTINATVANTSTAIIGTAGTMITNGGLTGGIVRLYQVLKIDRWLNLLGTAANLHNAYMLSADLGETMLFMVDALLNAAGMEFKDAEGNGVSFSDVISGTISNFIKGIVGAENYAEINLQISQFNRIYQAAMNAIYALGDIIDGVRQVSEVAGENTSKIGNALRNSGVVAENAYEFMFEDLSNLSKEDDRINKFGQNISNTEDKLQAIITVAQAISSIADAIVQMQESRQEFELALKDYQDPYGKLEENTKGQTDFSEAKLDSETPVSLESAKIGSRFTR